MDSSTKQALSKIVDSEKEFVIIIKTHAIINDEVYEKVENQWIESAVNINVLIQDLPSLKQLKESNEKLEFEINQLKSENQELTILINQEKNENEELFESLENAKKEIKKLTKENSESLEEMMSELVLESELIYKDNRGKPKVSFNCKSSQISFQEMQIKLIETFNNLRGMNEINTEDIYVNLQGKNDDTIHQELLQYFDLLKGSTSSILYANYMRFFKYIEYISEHKDPLKVILKNRSVDKSSITKHILASIRLNDFLSCCPEGAYLKLKIPISYWRKIDFEHWNNVRKELGLTKHTSKDWREHIL